MANHVRTRQDLDQVGQIMLELTRRICEWQIMLELDRN